MIPAKMKYGVMIITEPFKKRRHAGRSHALAETEYHQTEWSLNGQKGEINQRKIPRPAGPLHRPASARLSEINVLPLGQIGVWVPWRSLFFFMMVC